MKKVLLASLILVLADQLTKLLATKSLGSGSIPVIGDILRLTYVKNTGAVFGILQNTNSILIWISFIVIGFILFYLDKLSKQELVFAALVLSGAIGNLIDRIRLGYVIDFIDLGFWPVFNIADSLITIGVIGLILVSFREKKS